MFAGFPPRLLRDFYKERIRTASLINRRNKTAIQGGCVVYLGRQTATEKSIHHQMFIIFLYYMIKKKQNFR
jgi:hypothetical protein